jgi:hypothetical protein
MTDIERTSGMYKIEVMGNHVKIKDYYNNHYSETILEGLPFLLRYYNYIMNNSVSSERLHMDIVNYKRVFGEFPPYDFDGNYVKKDRTPGLLAFIKSTFNYGKKYTKNELERLDYATIKAIYEMKKIVGDIPTECSTI